MRRRKFIISSLSVAGGIAIGGYYLARPDSVSNPLATMLKKGEIAITPYVIIDKHGVTIIAPRAEMGQGIHGTLAVLVAEELDIAYTDIKVIHGPPSKVYANNIGYPKEGTLTSTLRRMDNRLGFEFLRARHPQFTGGQSSIRDAFVKMRKAGAAARSVLIKAAAKKFDIEPDDLNTKNGKVVLTDGTSIPYTELIDDAKGIIAPTDPPLKPREEWTQLGRSQPREDMVGKCTGTAEYSIDIILPDMLFATVLFNPHIGAGVKKFDDSKAKNVPGFIKSILAPDGIIVVATNTWYAMQAAKIIEVDWEPAPYPLSSTEHRKVLLDAFENKKGARKLDKGNVDIQLDQSKTLEGTYHVPYLAHATMEPLNAVAWLKDGKLDIWAGNQQPGKAQHIGAKIAGVPLESVNVHTTYMGGGFGRRLEGDFIDIATRAAMEMEGKPVKVTWSRETDMTHDVYRPLATAKFHGTVQNGKPLALSLDLSSPSLTASSERRNEGINDDVAEHLDKFSTAGAIDQPYKIKHYRVTAYKPERLLPVGWFRGVGESQNVFFHDSAIDELAHAAGADPLEMRMSILEHEPSQVVLKAVAKMSNWGAELPKGHARGVAYALSSDAATAQVIEISQKEDGIHIEKVFVAVDVGIALDPINIEAQVQSSVIFGLCAAMYGQITISDGKVDQTNFHDYSITRINQSPDIKVYIHESESNIYGVGESATPTAPPALGNAIFALTGQRIRELPFSKSVKFV